MSRQDDDYLKQKETEITEALTELHRRNGAIDVDPESPENQPKVEAEADPEPVEGQDAATDSEPATANEETEEGVEAESAAEISNADLLRQINEMKADFERSKLLVEKWKFVASREAGKRGFEKKQGQHKTQTTDLADLVSEDNEEPRSINDDDAEWRREQRGNIVLQEVGALTEEIEDFPEIAPAVQYFIEQKRPAYADALDNGSPSTLRKATQMLYKEAILDARAQIQKEKASADSTRRQDTATKVMAKKQASTPPKSAPSNAGVKKAGPKGGAEPTQEELIAEFARRRASGTYLE